jgi:hypothetical protein
MTLPLTRETKAAAYDYLRTTPPFNRWALPPSDEIKFRLTRNVNVRGYYVPTRKGNHVIGVSCRCIIRTQSLIELMAHEMVHLYQRIAKRETSGVEHNRDFTKLSERVCKCHGFDPALF